MKEGKDGGIPENRGNKTALFSFFFVQFCERNVPHPPIQLMIMTVMRLTTVLGVEISQELYALHPGSPQRSGPCGEGAIEMREARRGCDPHRPRISHFVQFDMWR